MTFPRSDPLSNDVIYTVDENTLRLALVRAGQVLLPMPARRSLLPTWRSDKPISLFVVAPTELFPTGYMVWKYTLEVNTGIFLIRLRGPPSYGMLFSEPMKSYIQA